jgi:PTS system cellobiose-specific IIC component
LIPAVAIIFSATVIYAFFDKVLSTTMIEWLYATIQKPLQGITDSLGGIIVISLTMPFLWFFGIHGTTIVNSIVVPFLRANYMDNQAILASGLDLTLENGAHIVTEQFFDNILMLSGTGIVGGIVIYLLFFAKSKQCKELGKLAAIPNLFNINEPILFGIPIVFNPIMAIPFFLVPLTSALVSYFAIYVGLVPFFTGVVVPWTVPPVISGFLLGGWRMALLQVVILLISFTMYFPFIRKVDMMNLEMEKAAVEEAVVEEKVSQN